MTVHKNLKGFTLIELLIVMAILGVLAVVVLVAINPVQQLARTRDTGRISSVAQIGHAVEAYYASHNGQYPAALTDLTTSGELTTIPGLVSNTLSTVCTGGDEALQGWCYDADATAGRFALWSQLESDSNLTVGGACDGTADAYAVYMSETGRTCIACPGAEPTSASTVAVCEN